MTLFESPFLLGVEQFERTLNRISKSSGEGYPPYNIEQRSNNGIRITIAVAGFTSKDLEITIEDNQLLIHGKQNDADPSSGVFLHRGIAARQFQRTFVLADGIEVKEATIGNGLLHIDLERLIAQPVTRRVEIKNS